MAAVLVVFALLGWDSITTRRHIWGEIALTRTMDLDSLLAPTSVQSFLESSWARRPFLAKTDQKDRFDGASGVGAVGK